MSYGLKLGFRSYDFYQGSGAERERVDREVDAINAALSSAGLPEYREPYESAMLAPHIGPGLGRCSCDHHGVTSLSGIGRLMAARVNSEPGPVTVLGYRLNGLVYLPIGFRGAVSVGNEAGLSWDVKEMREMLSEIVTSLGAGSPDVSGSGSGAAEAAGPGVEAFGYVYSARELQRDLCRLAPALGIPLEGRDLQDDVARAIEEYQDLNIPVGAQSGDRFRIPGDDTEYRLRDGLRTAWLLLFEGARLGLKCRLALRILG